MSARKKLNGASFLGSFPVALLIGGVTGSLLIFFVALIGLLVANGLSGDIRR